MPPMPKAPEPAPKAQKTSGKSKLGLWILIGSALLLVAGVILLLLPGGEKEGTGLYKGVSLAGMPVDGAQNQIRLNADGSCDITLQGETIVAKWELEGTQIEITDQYDEDVEGTLSNGTLTLDFERGLVMVFQKEGTAEAPTKATKPAEPDTGVLPLQTDGPVSAHTWYDGQWYGWWIPVNATGNLTDRIDVAQDACAQIDVNADGTGRFLIWDPTGSFYAPLANVEMEFDAGISELSSAVSVTGEFLDARVGYYDWLVDPSLGFASNFKDTICIEGTYVDPADPANTMDYMIILRPWGTDWSDIAASTASDLPYEDMMPVNYTDWYLPLIEAGVEEMPESFSEGEALIH